MLVAAHYKIVPRRSLDPFIMAKNCVLADFVPCTFDEKMLYTEYFVVFCFDYISNVFLSFTDKLVNIYVSRHLYAIEVIICRIAREFFCVAKDNRTNTLTVGVKISFNWNDDYVVE